MDTGREYDSVTGLSYHRARYYDATISRWYEESASPGLGVPQACLAARASARDRTHFG
jgi:hypothetical protein